MQVAHAAQYKKSEQPNVKMDRRDKQTFSKEDIQMVKKHMKRCLTSLIIRKIKKELQGGITSQQSEWPSSNKTKYKQQMLGRVWRKGNALTLLVAM